MLYSSTRRKRPHCARRIFLNPRTGPGTRWDLGQNGQTNLVPCAFAVRSTTTDHPGLHSLYKTGSSAGTATFTGGRAGLTCFAVTRFAVRFAGLLRRPAPRVVRVARICFTLARLFVFPSGFSPQKTICSSNCLAETAFTSCARRCACPCACCAASSCPASGKPKGFADDSP